MNTSQGYYSLIQYCPDLSRLEAANIGVVLFCPARRFLRAKTSTNNDRIRRFFGSENNDWPTIQTVRQSLERRLEVDAGGIQTLDDFQRLIDTRGNAVQLSAPRPMKVGDPERDLSDLFEKLVGQRHRLDRARVTPIKKVLDETVHREQLDRFLRRAIRVPVPNTDMDIEVPYGFQNGSFNLIQTVAFAATKREHLEEQASKHSIRGELLRREPNATFGMLDLIVVASFTPEAESHRRMVSEILAVNHVPLFTPDTMSELVTKIRTTATLVTPEPS